MRFRTRPSLIARLRDLNDAAAWREFEAGYRPFIRQVGVDAGATREALPDLVQDVLLTVVRVIPGFAYDPSRGRFRSWLARIVRSRWGDLARRSRRDANLKLLAGEGPLRRRKPSDGDDCGPATEAIQAAIGMLRATVRVQTWRCFELHVLHGRPAADVARELETSVNAVYVNSMRLMKRVEIEARRILDPGRGHETRPVSAGN
jgi:RNA polymerase sigma-70 factor (ECF subfamily)